jgi:YfiH family protein
MEWRERDGVRWMEAELAGARAAFSTRRGGVSAGPYESLNLGLLTGDEESRVLENRRRLAGALGRDPAGFLLGHQVHGDTLLRRDSAPDPNPYVDPSVRPGESDAQLTRASHLTPLVQVADCLPVAVAGEAGVAMLHCGWRGLAAGLIERGVAATGATVAAVGPGIGPCCYEVGPEVRSRFAELGEGVVRGDRLDLRGVARTQLERAGVLSIDASELCTQCHPELFFSYRRDGEACGRQAGAVWSVA